MTSPYYGLSTGCLGTICEKNRAFTAQAASGGRRWVSCSAPPAATRSGKSARPDSSQPGCGNTNKVQRNSVAHMDKSNHMDRSNHMGSTPARKLLAHL